MTNKFKQNIKLLIESGKIDEAKPLLEEYGKIEKNDLEFFSIASVIYLMEGNSEKAKKIIQEGLSRDSSNFDLLYNFAYLHHVNGDISLAFEYYTQAYNNATNDEEAENASVELAKLRSEVKNKKSYGETGSLS
ncbi:TPR repeat protein [Halalkalibacter wakoensis JCM 9140]|uniref:TPR repeat protein n=1 Tax=Halalkalibacter wakoensis JCM 9140 TaxID=1236970 RepID=W4Q5A5_9BACI|nr:hypothetical protein [Halalkalibacter wakoensis]GAE26529.1 TPR repeat protein [Halalkalibacter wakoensis JCM 9140]